MGVSVVRWSSDWQVPTETSRTREIVSARMDGPSRWQVSTLDLTDLRGLYVDGGPASRWACSRLVRCRASSAVH